MIGINEVRLSGQVSKIYPIKHFNNQSCMLIAEISTTDEVGTFAHRVSFLNDDAITFSKNAQLGANINIDAKLTPRLKNKDNPSGEIFFEIRCMRYVFVAESPIQIFDTATVYPETLPEQNSTEKSAVKRFMNKFTPQKNVVVQQQQNTLPPPFENNEPLMKPQNFSTQNTSFKA